ncbi:site-specific integrase [Nonomuraea bangladeshensis]|uniref:site-specific integrase n=1 Tax=Nonomuraea bangladeshensis TaxID=404385 RepID=UPI003C2FE34D
MWLHEAQLAPAKDAALSALDQIEPYVSGDDTIKAMWGALHLRAAVAYSRLWDQREAESHLDEARRVAEVLPHDGKGYLARIGSTRLYVLALCLGLRRGELLGLRWEDVDLDEGTLEVVQTLQRVGGELRFVRPKTENSERTIPLPEICVDALEEHRRRQLAERSDAWPDWEDHGLVFPSRRGTPMEPDNLHRSWGAVRKAAGLGEMRLHDMRHTCVSLLLDLGVPPHIVREIVGHSDIEVTMTIYAHASLDEKRKALGKLGDALA